MPNTSIVWVHLSTSMAVGVVRLVSNENLECRMEMSVPTQTSTTISVTSPGHISQDGSRQMGSQKRRRENVDTPAKRLKFSVSREEKLDLETLEKSKSWLLAKI